MIADPAEEFKFIKPGEVRTRFAPSPTGFLHVGTARTALFNFLFTKKNQGSFVLRIEDTDKERSRPEYEKDVVESLKWLGIEWNEGPDMEGPFGPYRQSERKEIYKKYLKKLLDEEKAYYCFCSEEELEAERQYQLSIGEAPRYSRKCAGLDKATVKKCLKEGKKSVIRFKLDGRKVGFEDLIKGALEFDTSLMGDLVIAKDLDSPLYNFAVVVDDFEMKISHIIRGEDLLPNTPRQILLQEALGFNPLKYAHLPLILGKDRSKLSKRHGAVSISEYKKEGYLPETMVNFIAFLGWNPGTEKEIYSMNALIKEFSIERVQKRGAIFNVKKLDSLNGFYIRQRKTEKLTEFCIPYLMEKGFIVPQAGQEEFLIAQNYNIPATGEGITFEKLQKIIGIYQERMKKLSEIIDLTHYFFEGKLSYDKELLKWGEMGDRETDKSLDTSQKILSKIKEVNFTKENLESRLLEEAEKIGKGDRGVLLWPLRAALTGEKASAGPFEVAEILGKEKTLKRIKEARELLNG